MTNEPCRRTFLLQSISGLGAAWISAQWPSVLAAATHAHQAAKSSAPAKFEFFTPEQAVEVDAITARIIPSDDSPGAHEAGAVYFIDRALVTFASESQKDYKAGLPELQARVRELYPSLAKFSAGTPEQQDAVLHSFDNNAGPGGRAFRTRGAQNFFETIRQHTITAFLIDPESDTGGNRGGVGWQLIGREQEHAFQPPFGFYDKNYPGWQSTPKDVNAK
jgi:gluconate 2-dehydrogenase gamma chain